tara:strand:- start:836 stop:1072 length:237 start_codon:yes stop_codon:yes gene_type:complete
MILNKQQIKDLKDKKIIILFHNSEDAEGDLFSLWFNTRFNRFVLEKNAEVIKSTKTIKPILNKLKLDKVISELTEILN